MSFISAVLKEFVSLPSLKAKFAYFKSGYLKKHQNRLINLFEMPFEPGADLRLDLLTLSPAALLPPP
jgi:hypothetical protein